jgi:hypothetical protein
MTLIYIQVKPSKHGEIPDLGNTIAQDFSVKRGSTKSASGVASFPAH